MSKIYPYTIFHLDHERLIALERTVQSGVGSENDQVIVKTYKDLMSNRPRFDPTIREVFGSRNRSFDESVEDARRDVDKMNQSKLKRKVTSAKKLIESGYYVQVADVISDTANEAVKLTTSINKRWMLFPNKKVKGYQEAWRSTEPYDVIQRFDEFFLKMPLGMLDLQEEQYAIKLV